MLEAIGTDLSIGSPTPQASHVEQGHTPEDKIEPLQQKPFMALVTGKLQQLSCECLTFLLIQFNTDYFGRDSDVCDVRYGSAYGGWRCSYGTGVVSCAHVEVEDACSNEHYIYFSFVRSGLIRLLFSYVYTVVSNNCIACLCE